MSNTSLNFFTGIIILITAAAAVAVGLATRNEGLTAGIVGVGLYLSASPRLVNQWERGIRLKLGKFRHVLQPGIAWLIPGVETMPVKIDMRVRSTPFSAEKTLTKDTVPVNVDAVLFWIVTDAEKAFLEVQDYLATISWMAQTTLRDIIGKSELSRMISDREALDKELQIVMDAKSSEWGITVQSVEIRDVKLPIGLEDAMSRKAQAEREKEARIILAESEPKVAEQIDLASEVYQRNPRAMQLRAMNMTYESIKERGALMIIPSTMSDAMNAGALGLAVSGLRIPEKSSEESRSEATDRSKSST